MAISEGKKKPRPPREGSAAAWAEFFSGVLKGAGFVDAAAFIVAQIKGDGRKRLPRGVYEKIPGSGDYWIRYADDKGKIRRQHVGKSLAAARDIAEQRRTEVRHGKFDPGSVGKQRRKKMTVGEMFAHYLPLRVEVRNKAEDQRYCAYWTELFGDLELDELTKADLIDWRAERLESVKPATCNRALTYLRAYYNLAIDDGHCSTNPAAKVKALRENNERDRFLQDEEEVRLRAEMPRPAFRLVEFAFQTGLRKTEQFSLLWENVDLKASNLKIVETKAGGSRFVPINQTARAILEELRKANPGSPWVFASRTNPQRPVNANNFINRVFRKALKKAGIKNFTWHDLRRTTGSRLAMAGQPLHTIAEILGQETARVTAIYARLSPTHLREAIESLSKPVTRTTTDTSPKARKAKAL